MSPNGIRAADDRIAWVRLSSCYLPLATPISDAKVLTGRQKPMTEVAMLFAEIETAERPGGTGLQLLEAGRRTRPVCACQRNRAGPHRRGSERHRQDLEQAVLGRGLGGSQRHVNAGHRRLRRRAVGPEGEAIGPVAGQAARLASRFGALLQHLGRFPAHAAGTAAGECHRVARARHRRDQAQGGPAGPSPRHAAGGGGAQAPGRHDAGDGRCQPAMGPTDRPAHVPDLRAVQPGLDRGAARCLRPRRPRGAGGAVRHAHRDRRNADQRGGTLAT